jgi:hypothetical protein
MRRDKGGGAPFGIPRGGFNSMSASRTPFPWRIILAVNHY